MGSVQEVQSIHLPYLQEWSEIDSSSAWRHAELYARWRSDTRASDEDIANVLGIRKQHVNTCRRVWEDFGGEMRKPNALSFHHYKTAVFWEDAEEWLEKAKREKLTAREMDLQRRTQRTAATAPSDEELDDPAYTAQADDEPGCTDDELPDEPRSTTIHTPSEPVAVKSMERRTDKAGKDLPPRLREAFDKGARLENPFRLLAAVWKELESVLSDTPEWSNPVLHNRKTLIQKHIDNAKAELAFATPFAVCPKCGGADDKCQACNGAGWICAENYRKVVQ